MDNAYSRPLYDGILGMSPKDESAGPLIQDMLFQQEAIPQDKFSLLLSPFAGDQATIQWGGYEESAATFDSELNGLVVHRVSGSFHWEFSINNVQVSSPSNYSSSSPYSFRPIARRVFLDTGTNSLRVSPDDYQNLVYFYCSFLVQKSDTNMRCDKIAGNVLVY